MLLLLLLLMLVQNLAMRWVLNMTPHGLMRRTKARMGGRR
jgi:hypothetical protein